MCNSLFHSTTGQSESRTLFCTIVSIQNIPVFIVWDQITRFLDSHVIASTDEGIILVQLCNLNSCNLNMHLISSHKMSWIFFCWLMIKMRHKGPGGEVGKDIVVEHEMLV